MENKITQLRKGILELAIMGVLFKRSHYGYSLIKALSTVETVEIKEGTIYPILNRMAKEGLLKTEWVESLQGPPRKYYALTKQGDETFVRLKDEFQRLVQLVENAQSTSVEKVEDAHGEKISFRRKNNE